LEVSLWVDFVVEIYVVVVVEIYVVIVIIIIVVVVIDVIGCAHGRLGITVIRAYGILDPFILCTKEGRTESVKLESMQFAKSDNNEQVRLLHQNFVNAESVQTKNLHGRQDACK